MGSFSIWHWLIVLVIVLLLFGTKKLRHVGADLGAAIRDFRKGMAGGERPRIGSDETAQNPERTTTPQRDKVE